MLANQHASDNMAVLVTAPRTGLSTLEDVVAVNEGRLSR